MADDTKFVYYNATTKVATFTSTESESLGMAIGQVEGPLPNPAAVVDALLKHKGINARGITVTIQE